MRSVCALASAKTAVCDVSWHTNAHRFLTILALGFARAPGRLHSSRKRATAVALRACRSTFSSYLTLFMMLRITGFSLGGSTSHAITAVATAESTRMSSVSLVVW